MGFGGERLHFHSSATGGAAVEGQPRPIIIEGSGPNGEYGVMQIAFHWHPRLNDTRQDWSAIAEGYSSGYRRRKDSRLELVEIPTLMTALRDRLPKSTALNVGSGPMIFEGRHIFAGPKITWPQEYWALDPSEGMWQVARQNYIGKPWGDRIHEVVQGIEENNLPQNHFDIVMATFSVENASDPVKGLENIFRVLKPGGLFAALFKDEKRSQRYLRTNNIQFPNVLRVFNVDKMFVQERWEGSGAHGLWACYTTNDQWKRDMSKVGFIDVGYQLPKVPREVRQKYAKKVTEWSQQGPSGVLFVAKKPF